MPGMKQVWKIAILPDPERPPVKSGWCIAGSKGEALEMINHPDGVVFDTQPEKLWPGSPKTSLEWSR